MNILFICHSAIWSNSGIHVANLASAIRDLGAQVAIAVPDEVVNQGRVEDRRGLPVMSFGAASALRFDGACADLIHAWTPRQHVAKATRHLSEAHRCRYVVHLEDNELVVTAGFLDRDVEELKRRANHGGDLEVPYFLSHPSDMHALLEGAAGMTAIIDRLLEFKPPSIPGLVIRPAAENDLFFPQARDPELLSRLEIDPARKIIVYNGNVHAVNTHEVGALYNAVFDLASGGLPITLVRLGKDMVPFRPPPPPGLKRVIIHVSHQQRSNVPRFLALADVLVQPGTADAFNSYRFPSKLAEFFAMGRPVILPAANIGLEVRDGEEALVLNGSDRRELAEKIRAVVTDRSLSRRLAIGARAFYERMFDWRKSGAKALSFYRNLL